MQAEMAIKDRAKAIEECSARLRGAIYIARIAGFVVRHRVGEKYSVTVGCTSTR